MPIDNNHEGPNLFKFYMRVINYPKIGSMRTGADSIIFSPNQKFAFQIISVEVLD